MAFSPGGGGGFVLVLLTCLEFPGRLCSIWQVALKFPFLSSCGHTHSNFLFHCSGLFFLSFLYWFLFFPTLQVCLPHDSVSWVSLRFFFSQWLYQLLWIQADPGSISIQILPPVLSRSVKHFYLNAPYSPHNWKPNGFFVFKPAVSQDSVPKPKSSGNWDFPGGPVVKSSHFHCRGCRFDPWSGN